LGVKVRRLGRRCLNVFEPTGGAPKLPNDTIASMSPRPAAPLPEEARARRAVGALFLTNGAIFANIVPRFPEIKAQLGLDNAVYGLAVIAYPLGAILAGLAAGALIRRFGSGKLAVAGTIATGLGVLAAGASPTLALFVAALAFGGAMDAVTDVAQNTHGLRVQRRYGKSIINSFHAIWSIGSVIGGAMSAAAIALHVPLALHLGISVVLFATVALVSYRFLLPGRDTEVELDTQGVEVVRAPAARPGPRVYVTLLMLVLIAIAGATVEDAGSSWATLYLSDSLGAPESLAALGFIALVGAQFVGRIIGDPLTDRFGQRTVAFAGGAVAFAGMGLALWFPSVPGTIAGFAAAGFGVATLIPAAMHRADELPGFRPGTGLTLVSWLLRLGFLLSPPLVGFVADHASLRLALLVVPLAGLVVMATAWALDGRTRE
jgi:MFS family permease